MENAVGRYSGSLREFLWTEASSLPAIKEEDEIVLAKFNKVNSPSLILKIFGGVGLRSDHLGFQSQIIRSKRPMESQSLVSNSLTAKPLCVISERNKTKAIGSKINYLRLLFLRRIIGSEIGRVPFTGVIST